MLLRRYRALMLSNGATPGNFKTDFILGNLSFLYFHSYIHLSGKIPIEIAEEICKTNFFNKSLFLSLTDKNLSLDDCIISQSLKTGLSNFTKNATLLNLDYNLYCSDYKQYREDLISISEKKGEEFFIEHLYFTNLSALKFTLNIIRNYDLLPKGISN